MFPPFENANDFYPGLIVWCDPACYEPNVCLSKLGHRDKKSRELRPCLVISVDYENRTFQGARLSATTPSDSSQWAKIDSPPPITWKLNDAFIWVGTPPTIAMVFNNERVMHPNKDTYYNTHPVATANLQNYWIHRQRQMRAGHSSTTKRIYQEQNNNFYGLQTPPGSPASPFHSPPPHYHSPPKYQEQAPAYVPGPFNATAYFQPQLQDHQYLPSPAAALSPISYPHSHPIVVPPGFTETRAGTPGWWRNPTTGWFWSASRGAMPPSPPR
ncbi:hypothetical protein K438DRAFT_1819023 [Mycena galopus ATCC 62051]|nr:hypothetical protein K438DRAFT_1819023 [Mycena galopus ATCC 62051]